MFSKTTGSGLYINRYSKSNDSESDRAQKTPIRTSLAMMKQSFLNVD